MACPCMGQGSPAGWPVLASCPACHQVCGAGCGLTVCLHVFIRACVGVGVGQVADLQVELLTRIEPLVPGRP